MHLCSSMYTAPYSSAYYCIPQLNTFGYFFLYTLAHLCIMLYTTLECFLHISVSYCTQPLYTLAHLCILLYTTYLSIDLHNQSEHTMSCWVLGSKVHRQVGHCLARNWFCEDKQSRKKGWGKGRGGNGRKRAGIIFMHQSSILHLISKAIILSQL